MTGALVILLICSGTLAKDQCTEQTARVVIRARIEQVVCGVGVIAAASSKDLSSDEFVRVTCRI